MFWRKRRSEEDFAQELRAHIELEADELQREGTPPDEAAFAARRAVGNATAIQELVYERHRWLWWERTRQDIRHAARTFRRNPLFTFAAVMTLAVGVGANTAIFSVLHAVVLKDPPFPEPDRLVVIEPVRKDVRTTGTLMSAPDFHDLRTQNTSFEYTAYHSGGETTAVIDGEASFVQAQAVTADFFAVLRMAPSTGRVWSPDEDRASLAVVSHRWARDHFSDSGAAIGRHLTVGARLVEIVGVAAPGFSYPGKNDIWLPAGMFAENRFRSGHNYFVIARLASGVNLSRAREDVEIIASRLERQYPENRYKSFGLTRLSERLSASAGPTLWLLLAATVCVLLVACANSTNLQLAQQATRTREMAVRSALGASRARLVRQLMTESLLLTVVGAGLGLGVGSVLLRVVIATAPAGLPGLDAVTMDSAVLLFAIGMTAVCGLIIGLAPALTFDRADVSSDLRQHSSRGVAAGANQRLRVALIIAEIAVSVVLVSAAGLLVRSFYTLTRADLGFGTARLLLVDTSIPVDSDEGARRATAFFRDLTEQTRSLPGVRGVAGVRTKPFATRRSTVGFSVDGGPQHRPGDAPVAEVQVTTPGYFAVMEMPLRSGRDFLETDAWGRPQVVVINEALAEQVFGNENPLGRRIRCGMTLETLNGMQIIGVVENARQAAIGEPARPEMFLPAMQHPHPGANLTMIVKTDADPLALTSTLRGTIRRMNPALPVRFSTMDELVHDSQAYPRFRATLVGFFSILTLGLACVGIYGVLAHLVAQRTNEIGLRLALGASPLQVFRSVVGGSLRWVLIGLAVGVAATLAIAEIVQTKLTMFAVDPPGSLMLFLTAGVITGAALIATCVPAFRAARVDPLVALRRD